MASNHSLPGQPAGACGLSREAGMEDALVLHAEILSSHCEINACCTAAAFFIMKSDNSHCESGRISH
jgi:hypothetical protein